ncbi:MAG: ABC transporter ATP-binding protein [Phycisphaerales bacterium]|nr:ABC transporter ATP-binding protein [Phycisphaerales bacterium]
MIEPTPFNPQQPAEKDGQPAASGGEALVALDGVSKRYGAKTAVEDLWLQLYAGEVFAFLGPNGAGKTTTLKMTTGLLAPDQGSVTVCGIPMGPEAPAAKQGIAYVPDQPFLYDKLTGREFINFTSDMYGVPRKTARERFDRIVDRLDMSKFIDQLSESYSHGMKQRVALAAAMIHHPRVLIVDEPIVGLDPRTIRVIKTMFREIAADGGTVFMSTHTLDVAEQIGDRIGILHQGRLIALGTLAELQRRATGRLEDIFLHLTDGWGDDQPEPGPSPP